ncbi:MAG: DNA polymerase IV, partial [Oscillospiraceae bacterium]
EMLARELGKMGAQISKFAKGQDTSPVRFANDVPQPKSVGNGYTFRRDLLGFDDIKTATTVISENVATRLRKLGLKCTGVQIQIKDTDLASITRQKKLPYQTDLAGDIKEAVLDLVRENWNLHQPIRKITVTAQGLTADDEPEQTSLYGDIKRASPRQEKLERTLDTIRGKYGRLSVMSANGIKDDLGMSIMESDDEE